MRLIYVKVIIIFIIYFNSATDQANITCAEHHEGATAGSEGRGEWWDGYEEG